MNTDDAFEQALSRALRSTEPVTVPPRVRMRALSIPDREGRTTAPAGRFGRLGSAGALAGSVGAVLIVVVTVAVVLNARPTGAGGPGGSGDPGGRRVLVVDSGIVTLEANSITVDAAGLRFTPSADMQVHSDPGDAIHQTLELTWFQHAREMRVNFYLRSNGATWGVEGMRTYDGREPGEWTEVTNPFEAVPVGAPLVGDVELRLTRPDGTTTTLRIQDMRLAAFVEGRTRVPPAGCAPMAPPADPNGGPVKAPVDQLGLAGKSVDEAAAIVAERGLCVSWRYEWRNAGEYWCIKPPPGKVTGDAIDTTGNLVIFVEAAAAPPQRAQPPLGWGC